MLCTEVIPAISMDALCFVLRRAFSPNRQLVAHHICLHAKACTSLRWPQVASYDNLTGSSNSSNVFCSPTRYARRHPALTETSHEQRSGYGSHDEWSSQRNATESPNLNGRIDSFLPVDPLQISDLEANESIVGRRSPRGSQDGSEGRVRAISTPSAAIPATAFPHPRQLHSVTEPCVMQQDSLLKAASGASIAPKSAIDSASKQKTVTETERTSNKNRKGKGTKKELQQELRAQQFRQQQLAQQQGHQQEDAVEQGQQQQEQRKKETTGMMLKQRLPPMQQQQARKRQHDHKQTQQQQEHEHGELKDDRNAREKGRKSKDELELQHKQEGQNQEKQPHDKVVPVTDAPPVYVMWDLDNKYPEHLDHKHLVDNLRSELRPYGKVMDIKAFCNYQTLNYVPKLWDAAMKMGMQHPLAALPPPELHCPMCGRRFDDRVKLHRHFKQLHEREHHKKLAHAPAAKKYMQSAKFRKFRVARVAVTHKKRGFNLEGILREMGVEVVPVPMGPQTADTALEREAMKLLTSVQVPVAGGSGGGQPVLCLMSDDHGFEHILKLFMQRGWKTVVISCTPFKNVNAQIDWNKLLG